jgi:hypothetical protein
MPTIKISLDQETYQCLSATAVHELRPVTWQAFVLLRRSLGLPFPAEPSSEWPIAPRAQEGAACPHA